MKEVVISVPEKEYSFVIELLRRLNFVQVIELAPTKEEFLKGLKEAVEEVNEIKQGKKQTQSLESFLDEV